jgi:DUF4097 and DUF4098 domain-containing protein YvlB
MATNTQMTLALAASLALGALPAAGQGRPPESHASHLRLAAYGQSRGPEQSERFSKTFRVGPGSSLDVANVSGDVTVTGGSGNEVVINAIKRARDRDPSVAKGQLAKVTIEANERAGRVEVRTAYPEGPAEAFGRGEAPPPRGGRGDRGMPPGRRLIGHTEVDVDYTVTVPSGTTCYLRTFAGDIRVINVKGGTRAETTSGNVQASDAGKDVWLKTISGDATLIGAAPDGDVNIGSVNGQVTARNVRARSLEASTISGDVHLTDVTCDRAAVRTFSGSVEFSGTLARNGRYEFKAHSGNVRLALAATPGFEVDAETFSGHIRSDLPVAARAGSGQEPNAWLPQRQTLRGTYGDSSAVLQLRSFSGDIIIAKR